MNGKVAWHYAALIGAATLIAGCGPDTPERGAAAERGPAESPLRPGESPLARNERRPAASRGEPDTGAPSIRPPTTATSPAAPGGAAPPAETPRLMARAEVHPIGDDYRARNSGVSDCRRRRRPVDDPRRAHGRRRRARTASTSIRAPIARRPATHLNPQSAPHGAANAGAAARHLGDLGNITADASGVVEEMLRDAQLGGDLTFIGKVVVVHKGQDDLSTQPGGDSGDPIACGVIEPAGEDVISRSGDANRGV